MPRAGAVALRWPHVLPLTMWLWRKFHGCSGVCASRRAQRGSATLSNENPTGVAARVAFAPFILASLPLLLSLPSFSFSAPLPANMFSQAARMAVRSVRESRAWGACAVPGGEKGRTGREKKRRKRTACAARVQTRGEGKGEGAGVGEGNTAAVVAAARRTMCSAGHVKARRSLSPSFARFPFLSLSLSLSRASPLRCALWPPWRQLRVDASFNVLQWQGQRGAVVQPELWSFFPFFALCAFAALCLCNVNRPALGAARCPCVVLTRRCARAGPALPRALTGAHCPVAF